MTAVESVGVVGAGIAGLGVAILLAEAGVPVDVIETTAEVGALGSGITLQGNALRVLRRLGVWEEVERAGYAFDSAALRTPDGALAGRDARHPDRRSGPARHGGHVPPRPGRASSSSAPSAWARGCGLGVTARRARTGRRRASTSGARDGTRARYDLVVGADGLRLVDPRRARHPRANPSRPAWASGARSRTADVGDPHRPLLRRPGLHRRLLPDRRGHASTPTSSRTRRTAARSSADERLADDARARRALRRRRGTTSATNLDRPARVNYTWFERHLLDGAVAPRPRGADRRRRPLLPAHHGAGRRAWRWRTRWCWPSCSPPRDALGRGPVVGVHARRLDRARTVVEASVQLGQWLLDGERGDMPGLMGRVHSPAHGAARERARQSSDLDHRRARALLRRRGGGAGRRASRGSPSAARSTRAATARSRWRSPGRWSGRPLPALTDRGAAPGRHGRGRAWTCRSSRRPRRTTTTGPAAKLAPRGVPGWPTAASPRTSSTRLPTGCTASAWSRCSIPTSCVDALDHALGPGPARASRSPRHAPGRELSDRAARARSGRGPRRPARSSSCTRSAARLDERLDRWYLSNTVGQPAENAVALSHLIFSGVLDRHPGPAARRGARRRLPAHPHRPLRPRLAGPPRRPAAAREPPEQLPEAAVLRLPRPRPRTCCASCSRAVGRRPGPARLRLPLRHGHRRPARRAARRRTCPTPTSTPSAAATRAALLVPRLRS